MQCYEIRYNKLLNTYSDFRPLRQSNEQKMNRQTDIQTAQLTYSIKQMVDSPWDKTTLWLLDEVIKLCAHGVGFTWPCLPVRQDRRVQSVETTEMFHFIEDKNVD